MNRFRNRLLTMHTTFLVETESGTNESMAQLMAPWLKASLMALKTLLIGVAGGGVREAGAPLECMLAAVAAVDVRRHA